MGNFHRIKIDQIHWLVNRLRRIIKRLSFYGMILVSVTIANIVTCILVILNIVNSDSISTLEITIILVPTFGLSLFIPAIFDSSRKTGDSIYDELVNELSDLKPDEETIDFHDVFIEMRIELKNFIKHSDLPLVPGKFGPALFFLINLAMLILSVSYYVPVK